MRRFTAAMVLVSVFSSSAWAQQAEVREAVAKPTRVVLFKNGLGVIESGIDLPAGNARFRVSPLPDATMGMFWVTGGKGTSISDIRATNVMTADKVASSVAEMLEANIGKQVSIRVAGQAVPPVEIWKQVKIRDIPREEGAVAGDYERMYGVRTPALLLPMPPRGQMVLYEEGENVIAMPTSQVLEVRLAAKDASFKVERPRKAMEFDAKVAAGDGKVNVSYLTQGIAWSPSYIIDISDEKKGVVTAKAVIINDALPLENVQAELVAGFPNIEFSSIPDAFSLTPLAQIIERIRSRTTEAVNTMLSNSMLQQRVSYGSGRGGGDGGLPQGPVMGEASEDLYFYPVKSLTLKKGERSYNELFTSPVEYEHVYTWEVPDYINEENRYGGDRNDTKPPPQVVWHALKVTNKSGMPWTTGPAATMKAGRVLGQSMIAFTPNNATTEVRITQVASINAEQSESEAERKRNAARFYGNDFDLVTIKGELQLTNYLAAPMTVKVTKFLSGEVLNSDNNATVTKLARGLRKVNPQSQVVWSVAVPPGKDGAVCVKYSYQVYVRN